MVCTTISHWSLRRSSLFACVLQLHPGSVRTFGFSWTFKQVPMKAIRIHDFGPTEEVLRYEEVPRPVPGESQLLVKVGAASLNRADLGLRSGAFSTPRDQLPLILGREFAGTVEALGDAAASFQVGQRVVGYTGTGGYAEYALAGESEVRPLPAGMSWAVAAAIPTVFLTAWFGLRAAGKLQSGEFLLVQAGSSGVGVAAIQIGKYLGATVLTTTSGEDKARRLRELGADVVIDYTRQEFVPEVMRTTSDHGADVVLEMIGGAVYSKSLEALAPGGRLFSIGGAFGPIPDSHSPLSEGRQATRFSITGHLKDRPDDFRELDEILALVAKKTFRVIIDRTFPLAEAQAAQRYLDGRGHFGKVVLTM